MKRLLRVFLNKWKRFGLERTMVSIFGSIVVLFVCFLLFLGISSVADEQAYESKAATDLEKVDKKFHHIKVLNTNRGSKTVVWQRTDDRWCKTKYDSNDKLIYPPTADCSFKKPSDK